MAQICIYDSHGNKICCVPPGEPPLRDKNHGHEHKGHSVYYTAVGKNPEFCKRFTEPTSDADLFRELADIVNHHPADWFSLEEQAAPR